jgi:thiol-disulfide isomerase/thioredoxin
VLFAAVALVASAPALARKHGPPPTGLRGIEYGRPAPDFLYDTGDGAQRLSDLSGRVVIVHFWASWCKPCMEEMPLLAKLRKTYGPSLAVVTLPWHEPVDDARTSASQAGWQVPVAADVSGQAQRSYSIEEVPTTLILRPDRSVSYVSIGEASWDELRQATDAALEPTPAPGIDPPARL